MKPHAGARRLALIAGLMTALFAASQAPAQPQSQSQLSASQRCAALNGVRIGPEAFALPTGGASVSEAVLMPADNATGLPEFCRVRGEIASVRQGALAIRFQVNLPTAWNEKSVLYGGGGTNGVLIEATGPFAGGGGLVRPALARGYVTYGSDSGHQGPGTEFFNDPEAFANYSHEAVSRSFNNMRALVQRYYGRAPRRNYQIGGSKGGQEALQAAQRYYADFDGVVAYYPAQQNQSLTLGWNRLWQFAYDRPGGALNTAQQALLRGAVMAACDRLDGAADGVVSNLGACAARFDVAALRCPGGAAAGDACLSDAQIAALRVANRPFTFARPMPNGVRSVGPWPVFIGGDLDLWFGTGEPGSQQAFYRPAAARPEAMLSSGISAADWAVNVLRIANVYDASTTDLDGFRRRGGRMILVQGTTDMLVPYTMTNRWFENLRARYGARLPGFVRYYVVPGFGHGRGAFRPQWDSLDALDAWVETGRPPETPLANDGNTGAHRTRPLCEYPRWPRYTGQGSIDQAANYRCVTR